MHYFQVILSLYNCASAIYIYIYIYFFIVAGANLMAVHKCDSVMADTDSDCDSGMAESDSDEYNSEVELKIATAYV